MATYIREIDSVYCIKGTHQSNQTSALQTHISYLLKQEERVLINLCELDDENGDVLRMLEDLKMTLEDEDRLHFYGYTQESDPVVIRSLGHTFSYNLAA